jgi:glycosyltransferase involved in cell wall biosynthesis
VEGSGFTFRHGDPRDLERMLRLLISEPGIRKAAAIRAREKVRERYLWNGIAKEVEDIYLQLAGGKIPPQPASAQGTGFRGHAA